MKKNDSVRGGAMVVTAVTLALALVMPASAQDIRPAASSMTGIVARFPAESGADRDRLAGEMLALGEPSLASFAGGLPPAGGPGFDANARFAVNAVAVYASAPGGEARRARVEAAFIKALAAASDVEVRTFLLSQLRIVGRDPSARAAAPLLANAALVEPATQLMLSVRSTGARQALINALPASTGPARVTIVKALGELEVLEAHNRLVVFAKDADPALRRAALAALARIGSPKSYDALTQAAAAAGFTYEPGNAIGALFEYARQLGRRGASAAAEKVCRFVLAGTGADDHLSVRAAALAILVDTRGVAALPDLLAAGTHSDPAYRNAALLLAQRFSSDSAVAQWSAKAGACQPDCAADIVAMLGRQGNVAAVPFLRTSVTSSAPAVALAAAEALAHVEHGKALPELMALLKSAPAETAPRVASILLWTIDEPHLDSLAAMLDDLQPAARAAAIGVLGARSGRRFAARVMPLTADGDPTIRAAAFGALAGVSSPADLPALFTLLDAVSTENAVPVQKAIVAAALQIAPDSERADPLVRATRTSTHAERIIELMTQLPTKQALATVVDLFESAPAGDVKAAAFRVLTRWPGVDATGRLFAIFLGGNETYRNQAFAGFVRQISASSLTDDQKVLQLKKAMAHSSTVGDRRILLRAFQGIRTFQSFLMAVSLLDDSDLAGEAAGAVMRMALPTAGKKDGFTGTIVRQALERALPLLKGPQSDEDKDALRAYLAGMPGEEGFVPMFNGRDLSGWQGLVGNPITRAKMSPEELKNKQVEADARARTTWSVRDGSIVFNGKGDNLCSIKDYGDFEMLVDWRITKDGDSGIYLRGSPQVQIWDPARIDVGAQVGSGGLYNNQKNPKDPLVFADNPVGEWNTFRIMMVGERVTVFLNGIKVVDNVVLENYWDRKQPIFPKGALELQAHGTDLTFRDIYVREIVAASAAPPTK